MCSRSPKITRRPSPPTVSGAVNTDPALIPDIVTAVETKSYAGFAVKHLSLLLSLAGIVGGNPALVSKLSALTAPSTTG